MTQVVRLMSNHKGFYAPRSYGKSILSFGILFIDFFKGTLERAFQRPTFIYFYAHFKKSILKIISL